MDWTHPTYDNKTVKQVFRWEPSSRRSQGRPMKRWMDYVEDLHRSQVSASKHNMV